MTYEILKYIFYVLMCVPVLVVGLVFFLRLKKNKKELIDAEIIAKEQKAIAKEKARQESLKRQSFYEHYDKNKVYK